MNRCGCEVGDDCTKTTMCHVQLALEDQAEEVERLQSIIDELEPYTDAINCYASTISQHDGNRVAKIFKEAALGGKPNG